jgi:hypothetical protein
LTDACLSDGLNDATLNLSFGQQWIDNRPFTRPLDKRGGYPISLKEVESRRKPSSSKNLGAFVRLNCNGTRLGNHRGKLS